MSAKREYMPFPVLWCRKFLRKDDISAGRLIKALCAFAETGQTTDFADDELLAEQFETMSDMIGRTQAKRAIGRMGGRPKKTTTQTTPQTTGGSKEEPHPEPNKQTNKQTKKETNKRKAAAFLSWNIDDFRFAAEEVCAAHPEYRPYLDAFVGYWTEEHRDGGPRFLKTEAFSMASRLATWKRLQEQRAPQWPIMPPPPRTAQEALDLIPEANS